MPSNPSGHRHSHDSQQKGRPTRSPSAKRPELAPTRWLVLAASLGLLAVSTVLRLQPSLLSKDSGLASDAFGKVGIVLMCVWLAWPGMMLLWRSPYGMSLVLGAAVVVGFFVYRPKTLLITGPFLAIAIVLALILGWVRRLK